MRRINRVVDMVDSRVIYMENVIPMIIDAGKKNWPLMSLAILLILQRWFLAGIVGMVLFLLGFWLDNESIETAGLVLAAPEIWASAVVFFVLLPLAAFNRVRENRKSTKYS